MGSGQFLLEGFLASRVTGTFPFPGVWCVRCTGLFCPPTLARSFYSVSQTVPWTGCVSLLKGFTDVARMSLFPPLFPRLNTPKLLRTSFFPERFSPGDAFFKAFSHHVEPTPHHFFESEIFYVDFHSPPYLSPPPPPPTGSIVLREEDTDAIRFLTFPFVISRFPSRVS